MRLSNLAAFIPQSRIDTEEIVRAAGGSRSEARVFQRMFGLNQVAATPETEDLCDQFVRVLDALWRVREGPLPDTLIYVHGQPLQYPDGNSPMHLLSSTHPFLQDVEQHFEVDQHNCGGMFWALDMARTLLKSKLARKIAVIAGDCHIGIPVAQRYVPGCTLMGDAYCGLVLDEGGSGWQVSPVVLHTHPQFSHGRAGSLDEMSAFFTAHSGIVKAALDEIGFDWSGSTRLLPHNVNRLAWQMLCKESGLDEGRVDLSLLPDIGHCYTCDPFLLLKENRTFAANEEGRIALMSVGMGGFAGACHLRWVDPTREHVSPCHINTSTPKQEDVSCSRILHS